MLVVQWANIYCFFFTVLLTTCFFKNDPPASFTAILSEGTKAMEPINLSKLPWWLWTVVRRRQRIWAHNIFPARTYCPDHPQITVLLWKLSTIITQICSTVVSIYCFMQLKLILQIYNQSKQPNKSPRIFENGRHRFLAWRCSRKKTRRGNLKAGLRALMTEIIESNCDNETDIHSVVSYLTRWDISTAGSSIAIFWTRK